MSPPKHTKFCDSYMCTIELSNMALTSHLKSKKTSFQSAK